MMRTLVRFITGGPCGFGLEIARVTLKHGDAVVAAARKPEEGYRLYVGSRVVDRRRTIWRKSI
jgi:NAD(P)-dependent dehydrogenase (short-subunit alcohol dehydrogenase family)